jgi:4-hydroxyproline epimerase
MRVRVIDSHTGGESTRVVVEGGPDLGAGPLAERLRIFRERFDDFRSAVVNEPRGNDAMVGALLCHPHDPSNSAAVIFFNNVGYLGMCGHGAIGVAVTLAHLGLIAPGVHRIETPVGIIEAVLHEHNEVTINNVPSYRHLHGVRIHVEGFGQVRGDVAWGGNWFFLTETCPFDLNLSNLEALTSYAWAIRQTLEQEGLSGAEGAPVDHIEISSGLKNFVLCPGKAYDRSPCGTGTSAKLACLYADGKLKPGDIWRQPSIVGSVFEGSITECIEPGGEGTQIVIPHIRGSAFVNAEATLILDPRDPFVYGIRA